jgi:hypothetical protein
MKTFGKNLRISINIADNKILFLPFPNITMLEKGSFVNDYRCMTLYLIEFNDVKVDERKSS